MFVSNEKKLYKKLYEKDALKVILYLSLSATSRANERQAKTALVAASPR